MCRRAGVLVSLFLILIPGVIHAQVLSSYIFDDQLRNGFTNTSWSNSGNNPVNTTVSSPVYSGTDSVSLDGSSTNSVVRFSVGNPPLNLSAYTTLTFAARAAASGNTYFVSLDGGATHAELANYGGQPPTNAWKVYTIPLFALNKAYTVSGDFIFANDTYWQSTNPTIYLDEIGFTGIAQTPTPTPTPAPLTAQLSADSTVSINPFDKKMLGMALVNWEFSYGNPFPNSVPGLVQAYKAIHVGLIRYAGGLWANWVGWDRIPQRRPYTTWTKNGNTYSFQYGTDEIDSLGAFAKNVGADVMIQVDVSQNDPAMWADMVKYTNIENNYNFKYWEMGNELDGECNQGGADCVTPAVYKARVQAYSIAMKAVDPTIQIVGGVPSAAHDAFTSGNWSSPALSQYLTQSAPVSDALSWHWYQQCGNSSLSDMYTYSWPGVDLNLPNSSYSRSWSKTAPTNIQTQIINPSKPTQLQGVTELNYDACDFSSAPQNSNHANALWAADVLGRLAYNGLDFATWYTGYGSPQQYALIYKDPDNLTPTGIKVRPTYYTYFMYANYFGDQMVKSASSDENDISVWAAKDSQDTSKLSLLVTNLSASTVTAPISVSGFTPTHGDVYQMTSTNPTDMSTASNTDHATTTINGGVLDPMNVATSAAANIHPTALNITTNNFTYIFPPYSVTAIVLHNSGSITPAADSNADGKINALDFGRVIINLGWTGVAGTNISDLNNDGKVDFSDVKMVLAAWK